jgi:hypothetical protein
MQTNFSYKEKWWMRLIRLSIMLMKKFLCKFQLQNIIIFEANTTRT